MSSDQDYIITDNDLIELTGYSILQTIMLLIKNICLKCGCPLMNAKMSIIMPCKSKICKSCVIKIIKQDTEQKLILNYFEKSKCFLKKI